MKLRLSIKIHECVVLYLVKWRAKKMVVNYARRIFCLARSLYAFWVLLKWWKIPCLMVLLSPCHRGGGRESHLCRIS